MGVCWINCGTNMEVEKRLGKRIGNGSARDAGKMSLGPVSPLKEEDLRPKILRKLEWHQTRSLCWGTVADIIILYYYIILLYYYIILSLDFYIIP